MKSTAFILLQGVPTSVSLEAVRESIQAIPGVISVHELHIWQLSESKIVASVHVLVKKTRPSSIREKTQPNLNRALQLVENGTTSSSQTLTSRDVDGLVSVREDGDGSEEFLYMTVAADIRRALHEHGIHSSTIQPEYCVDGSDGDSVSSSLHSFSVVGGY